MPAPLPGSVEFFLSQVTRFIKDNAQGDVRCLVLIETGAGQFWISTMVPTINWQLGMLRTADVMLANNYTESLKAHAAKTAQEQSEQELRSADIPGKPS